MRFHGVMILRDEADVIVQNLEHLLTWADGVYALDLGSTDNTWDLVQEMSRRDKRIVPFKTEAFIFTDVLRGMVFNQFRDRFETGDWVLRVDADEFYHVTPPQFVQDRLRPLETAVWLQWYYFRLLEKEVEDYETGRVNLVEDRKRSIDQRRRYYKVSQYSEPRMFRYRRGMKWPEFSSFPFNAGYVARERIPIRHYPHRDPLQMQTRFRLRERMMKLEARDHGPNHWNINNWRAEIMDENGIPGTAKGPNRGLAAENGIDTGELMYWEPGTPLVEQRIYRHVPPPLKRITQRLIHPLLLPMLDASRKSWDPAFAPEAIPAEVQSAMQAEADSSRGN